MKTKLFIFAMVGLFFAGCLTCKKLEKPNDVGNINWENYNDVRTVFYNCKQQCMDEPNQYEGDTIMVYGWGKGGDSFVLCEDSTLIPTYGYSWYHIEILNEFKLPNLSEGIGIYYIKGIVNNHCQTSFHCDLVIYVLEFYVRKSEEESL
jgi:hypothetical protein